MTRNSHVFFLFSGQSTSVQCWTKANQTTSTAHRRNMSLSRTSHITGRFQTCLASLKALHCKGLLMILPCAHTYGSMHSV